MSITARIRKGLSGAFVLDVELTVDAGITILFGASGSGKSTLLRCLAGLARPDSGRIVFGDVVVFDPHAGIDVPPQRRQVGVVFQQLALFPHLSAAANIGYGLHDVPRPERDRRITAIAQAFRIHGLLERRPAQLSGGERQRVALARTLVTDPSVLLLDEPLTALDHDIQSRILDDFRAWNEAHRIPVLYVTHSHREAFALGEQVIVLRDGRIMATGTPHAVLDHPAHGTIAELAGFENIFDARVLECSLDGGTMRVIAQDVELEVPMTGAPAGTSVTVAIRAGDIMMATEPPRGISARNILPGRVVAVARQGPTFIVDVSAGVEHRFIVHMTPGAAASLAIEANRLVWLIIKSYSCRIISR